MYLYNDGQKIDLISYTQLMQQAPTIRNQLNKYINEKSQISKQFKEEISKKKFEIVKAMMKGQSTVMKEAELQELMKKQRGQFYQSYVDIVITESQKVLTNGILDSQLIQHNPLWDDNTEISIIDLMIKNKPSIFFGKVGTPFDPNSALIQFNKKLVNLEITDKKIEQTIKTIDTLNGGSSNPAAGAVPGDQSNPDMPMAPGEESQFRMMGSAFSAPLDLDSINVQAYLGAKLETRTPEKRREIKDSLILTEKYNKVKEHSIKGMIDNIEAKHGDKITDDTRRMIFFIKGLVTFNKTIRVRGNTKTSLAKALKAAAKNPTGEKKAKKAAKAASTPVQKLAEERGVILPGSNKKGNGKGKGYT